MGMLLTLLAVLTVMVGLILLLWLPNRESSAVESDKGRSSDLEPLDVVSTDWTPDIPPAPVL